MTKFEEEKWEVWRQLVKHQMALAKWGVPDKYSARFNRRSNPEPS
jgi:hypothetical protein